MTVNISKGNNKMGAIKSVSLPAVTTCIQCACNKKCYAKRMENRWKNVREAYANNLNIVKTNPGLYWREIEAAIMLSRFFRFHVSGDILDNSYFKSMVEVAQRNPHCEILCFTKKYRIVNDAVQNGIEVPENLHIIFSAWDDLEMKNPNHFPEAHVRYRDGTTTASTNAKECSGNCTDCAITDDGCWSLHFGEQVVFNEH